MATEAKGPPDPGRSGWFAIGVPCPARPGRQRPPAWRPAPPSSTTGQLRLPNGRKRQLPWEPPYPIGGLPKPACTRTVRTGPNVTTRKDLLPAGPRSGKSVPAPARPSTDVSSANAFPRVSAEPPSSLGEVAQRGHTDASRTATSPVRKTRRRCPRPDRYHRGPQRADPRQVEQATAATKWPPSQIAARAAASGGTSDG
jgi:hypothetical protein